jgi:hypothetical protein
MLQIPDVSPDAVLQLKQRIERDAALPVFNRHEAIRAAATVAQALAETLHQYQTCDIKGAMLAAACMSATIADGLVAVVHVVDSNGQSHVARPQQDRGAVRP